MKWLFYAIVVSHLILVIGNAASFFILPFATPWYVAAPLCTFIVWVSFTPAHCPATTLENKIRLRLGKKQIGGFIGHYLVKPIRRIIYVMRLWGWIP